MDCLIYPYDLKEEYIDDIEYDIIQDGNGVKFFNNSGNCYIIADDTVTSFTVTASLNIGSVIYESSMDVEVKRKITSLRLESDITSVEVGNSYKLIADFTPLDAEEKISYVLNSKYYGVSIDGDILTIDPEYNLSTEIETM